MNKDNRNAMLALGLTFGGIWTGDSVFLTYLDSPLAVLFMRCASTVVYVLYLVCAVAFFQKREISARTQTERLDASRRFLQRTCNVCIVCYLVGAALILLRVGHPYIGFALTKLIGAPLSVSCVYLIGSPQRTDVTLATAKGVVISFLLFAFMRFLNSAGLLVGWATACVACLFLAGAYALIGRDMTEIRKLIDARELREEKPAVILRPLHKIMSPPLIAGLLIASLMLGFVRHGLSAVEPLEALTIFIFIVLTLVLLVLWHGSLSMGLFFQVGVISMTAAILLEPLLNLSGIPFKTLLLWCSSAAFEVTALLLCIWTSHNSKRPFMASIVSRAIMVFGHMLGTLLVIGEQLLSLQFPNGTNIAASLLVFIFIVLLLFSYRMPTLQVLFFSLPPNDFDADPSPEGEALDAAAERRTPDEVPNVEEVISKEEQWRDYRRQSCRRVADTYNLTKREVDVLYELSEGRSVSYMADRFVLSPNTVKMHIRHIYQKLDVHSKQEVIDLVNAAGADASAKASVNG